MARRKIACVGDSITLGAAGNNYPLFLGWLLGADYDVGNFGIAGATMVYTSPAPYVTSPECAASLRWIADGGDVVICLGTNDTQAANWDEAAFIPDTLKLIAMYYAAGASRVFLCLPPPSSSVAPVNGALLLSAVIPRLGLAAPEGGARLIDLYNPMQIAYPTNFADTVHPERDGMLMMAEIIQPFITIPRKIVRAPSSPDSLVPVIENIDYRWADPLGGGKRITITGRNFLGSTLEIGTLVVAPFSLNATEIKFDAPPRNAGTYLLRVRNALGVDSAIFEYYSPGDTDFATVFAMQPDYVDTAGDGVWDTRKGADLISAAQAPLAALVAPTQSGDGEAETDGVTASQGLRDQERFVDVMSSTCGGLFAVLDVDTLVAQAGNVFDDPAVMSHPYTGAIGLGISLAGARGYVFRGDLGAYATATCPMTVGRNAITFGWANRRDIRVQVNDADYVTNPMGTAGSIQVDDLLQFLTSWNGAVASDMRTKAIVVYSCRVPDVITQKNQRWASQRFA